MPKRIPRTVLPWLSIRSKLIIAFTGLSVIPVILVGLHGILSNMTFMENIALENLTHDVHTIRENTSHFLQSIESDLRVIREARSFSEIAPVLSSSVFRPRDLQYFQEDLVAFARTKKIYYQVRVLNAQGNEVVCVEAACPDDSVRCYRSLTGPELRETGSRYYFLLVEGLAGEQIAYVPAELQNRSGNKIAVVSFAMPIMAGGRRTGILVANVYAKDLFQTIEQRQDLDVGGKVVLVSGDGHYLYHSEKKTDWNKLLASRDSDRLQSDFSEEVTTRILSGSEGTMTDERDECISYGPLFGRPPVARSGEAWSTFSMPIFVFESVPHYAIMGPVTTYARTFAVSLVVFLFAAVGLGLLATRQFTRPIAVLHKGAKIIAGGNYVHRLEVETHDEIEKLAQEFNAMAASLDSHERELLRHRTHLQELVDHRTHELAGEKTKLQTILDNIPSAIVLLDEEFRIQSASAAFSSITGCRFEDVRGRACQEIFCGGGFCRACVSRRAKETRNIESHIERLNGENNAERFLEHTAIPMTRDGEIRAYLEIITDVTERKRLEKHLLQSEKLAAAGEMSAIIAHEFRNSLTSTKMILQLQQESTRLTRSERKSLVVALTSIDHMEAIVAELLSFARSKPMEFRRGSLNNIVEESITLMQPRLAKQHIRLVQELDPRLPQLAIDESRLKEALVNILLNAVQAIDGAPGDHPEGTISILTKYQQTSSTMRTTALGDGKAHGPLTSAQLEIVLAKGTECALIEICDNGCGMEQHDLEKIFEPFFTTKSNGTGLGLPMVKRTVNAHGGIVTVTSNKGEGTAIRLYIPVAERG